MDLTLDRPLLLRGKIVQPDGTGLDRYVLVENGVIVSVSRRRPPLTRDAVLVELGNNDWIYPGLVDLHTHTDYNMLPLWKTDKVPFDNRFKWRSDDGYRMVVSGGHDLLKVKQYQTAVAVFAELQAIAGGTATIQESQSLESNQSGDGNPVLCRGTGGSSDLGLGAKQIFSVVDFFKPNASGDVADPQQKKLEQYLNMRSQGTLQATLAHLAEGRSGFGNERGVDAYSRLEFETLMQHAAFQDAEAVRSSPLALIHCSGIDVENAAHINFLRERNISVVWSPVSNLLYGDTLDIERLVSQGVNVAIGSDWSPSGSKHLWEEAKFVRFYFEAIGSLVSDEQVFQMVTTNAARCLGLKTIGRIEPGCFADFFILRSPLESDNAVEVFFKTTDQDVRAVIIGGRPVYGAREFLNKFQLELQPLPRVEGAAVRNKVVHLPAHLEINVERDFGELETLLKNSPLKLKRNNLLVSADTPYRERINLLRQWAVGYGWQVQQWRRKKQKPQAGKSVSAPAPSA
jgi:5-methylthioadenosine/S-adenosylhomocysteine deaminase